MQPMPLKLEQDSDTNSVQVSGLKLMNINFVCTYCRCRSRSLCVIQDHRGSPFSLQRWTYKNCRLLECFHHLGLAFQSFPWQLTKIYLDYLFELVTSDNIHFLFHFSNLELLYIILSSSDQKKLEGVEIGNAKQHIPCNRNRTQKLNRETEPY